MLQKEAFNISSYENLPRETAIKHLRGDARAYLLEADIHQAPEKRATHLEYQETGNGKDFICSADEGLTLNRFTDPVSQEIFTKFLGTDRRLIGLWISGPNPSKNQPEGRINIYIGHEDRKGIDYFPIPIRDWDNDKYLKTAENMCRTRYSQDDFKFNNLEQLRETPFFLEVSKDDDPIKILAKYIDISRSFWRAIVTGQVKAEQEKLMRQIEPVIDHHFDRLAAGTKTYEQRIGLGARLERDLMRATGRTIHGFGSGCGASNNELLINIFKLHSGGKVIYKKETSGVYVKECPHCHKQINRYMTPGRDFCPGCGRVFPGVC